MVNADRVKRKLPSLLVDGSTTKKKGWNSRMRYSYRLDRFQEKNPGRYNFLTNRIIADLTELDKAVSD